MKKQTQKSYALMESELALEKAKRMRVFSLIAVIFVVCAECGAALYARSFELTCVCAVVAFIFILSFHLSCREVKKATDEVRDEEARLLVQPPRIVESKD